MNPFLVTATDPRGHRETFSRDASSLDHLRIGLERDGFTDIEFIDDEFSAMLRKQRTPDQIDDSPGGTRLEVALRKGPAPVQVWLHAARNFSLLLGVNALAIAYGVWSGRYGWAVLGAVVILGWVWLLRRGLSKADHYNDLLRAAATGQLAEAGELIERISADPGLLDNETLQTDLVFRRAALVAIAGDLPRALRDVEPCRNSPQCANGGFEGRVASLRYQAGDMAAYLRSMEDAFRVSGEIAMQRLDLAFGHARVGDAERARALIDGLDRSTLSALHEPLAVAVDALLLQHDGDAGAGLEKLEQACESFSQYAGNPAVWPFMGILLARLAVALEQAGRHEEAMAAFTPWRDVIMTCTDPKTRLALAKLDA